MCELKHTSNCTHVLVACGHSLTHSCDFKYLSTDVNNYDKIPRILKMIRK